MSESQMLMTEQRFCAASVAIPVFCARFMVKFASRSP